MTRLVIGIDVGGTKIAGGLVDLDDGGIRTLLRRPTPAVGAEVITEIVQMARNLANAAGGPVSAIGIGLPELVDREGRIVSEWNFHLDGDALRQAIFSQLGPVRLRFESDVRCAAQAEVAFGAGRGLEQFSYISIGTGISSTQVIGGKVLAGVRGFAVHFGTSDLVSFTHEGEERSFNLEEMASGRRMRALGEMDGQDLAGLLVGTSINSRHARLAVRAMASYLGQMVNMLDPEAVVIGGGLGLQLAYFDALRAVLPEFIWAPSRRDLPVLPAGLGESAGIVGAAAIA